jgi:H+/gluconate symporter-like permease
MPISGNPFASSYPLESAIGSAVVAAASAGSMSSQLQAPPPLFLKSLVVPAEELMVQLYGLVRHHGQRVRETGRDFKV